MEGSWAAQHVCKGDEMIISDMIEVPGGPAIIGSHAIDPHANERDLPYAIVYLPTYYIARYPVTNREYAEFVSDTNYHSPANWRNLSDDGQLRYNDSERDHPVICVSWADAMFFCQWLTVKTQHPFTLPTEAQWEKAARGPDGRIWPWGDNFNSKYANTVESGIGSTCSVFEMEEGKSPYGCFHMIGNAWEWCLDCYSSSGYNDISLYNPFRSAYSRNRSIRGGSYNYDKSISRCAARDLTNPFNGGGADDGFRVCLNRVNPEAGAFPGIKSTIKGG